MLLSLILSFFLPLSLFFTFAMRPFCTRRSGRRLMCHDFLHNWKKLHFLPYKRVKAIDTTADTLSVIRQTLEFQFFLLLSSLTSFSVSARFTGSPGFQIYNIETKQKSSTRFFFFKLFSPVPSKSHRTTVGNCCIDFIWKKKLSL